MIYLKTENEEELTNTLGCWTKVDQEDNEYIEYFSSTHSLDVIGTIYKETDNILTTKEGVEYNEMVAIDGYHANLDLHGEAFPESLESFVINKPNNPVRSFA